MCGAASASKAVARSHLRHGLKSPCAWILHVASSPDAPPPRRPPSMASCARTQLAATVGLPRRQGKRCEKAASGRGQERDAGRATRATIPSDRTTSRRACVRPSARCASACACGAQPPCSRGSACCVYGLTFTSHFYGAKRTVGYVPFNSETLVTGKLFEDIRDAVFKLADPEQYDAIVIINLCVPTASGVPLQLLPRRSTASASSASTFPASACRRMPRPRTCWRGRCCKYARREAEQGPGSGAARAAPRKPTDHAGRRNVSRRSRADRPMLEPLGLAAGPVVPTREWRELYAALDCAAVAAIHPFYTASVREFEAAGRPIVGSAPVGYDGTAAWLESIGEACGVARAHGRCRQEQLLPAISGALAQAPIKGRITLSGYEGSELLVGAAADRERRGRPLCRHGLPAHAVRPSADRAVARGEGRRTSSFAPRSSRTSRRSRNSGPTSPSARRRSSRRPRSAAIPALYFTNLISARPLMGVGRRRLARQGRQRRAREQEPVRRNERLLRRRRRRATRPASGRTRRATGPSSRPGRQAEGRSQRPRRWA